MSFWPRAWEDKRRSASYRPQRRRWIAYKLRWADLGSDHLKNLDANDDVSAPRVQSPDGFTLIELMIVVAILEILVSVATLSYNHCVIKAKTVEGEIVVHKVERLEYLYHASNHAYTDSLADLGFAMTGTLKYYTPEIRMGSAIENQISGPRIAGPGICDERLALDEPS